jgi:transposase-like protein
MTAEPTTLQEAIVYFSNPDNCLSYLVARRWADGVVCPTCGSKDVRFTTRRMWECRNAHPRRQFSIKIGTVLEDSPISLDKWLMAMWMIANCKNGISSYEIARDLHITQKSAWFMLHRVRRAMQEQGIGKLTGEVEVDETFIGGKARNMHIAQRRRRITGSGGKDKTAVVGLVQRGGKVQTLVVENRKKKTLQEEVKKRSGQGRRSTPMNCFPTRDWKASTPTKSSTMRCLTSKVGFTPTLSKTFGVS